MLGTTLLALTQPADVSAQPLNDRNIPERLQLTADRQFQDSRNNISVAEGNVRATLGSAQLQADRIEFDANFRTFHASGSVRLKRGKQSFQATRLRYNLALDEGVLEDVYGVIDLDDTSDADELPLASEPTIAEELAPLACPPVLPPRPDWQPHPWAVTAWGGQMIDAAFGDTFMFDGRMRPETVLGMSLQKRIFRAGPLAIEMEADLFSHIAQQQRGGEFNQSKPYAQLPAQSFGEGILGIGARVWLQPWLNVSVVEGVSYNSSVSLYEKTFRENYSQLLNYLGFEVEAAVSDDVSLVGRIHHRSGAFGTYNGVTEGSNAYLLGLRYRWGQDPVQPSEAVMPPPRGCELPAGARIRPSSLAERLESISLGDGGTTPVHVNPSGQEAATPSRQSNAEQKAERDRRVAAIDQGVDKVSYQGSFSIERRSGIPVQRINSNVNDENRFGVVQVPQLKRLGSRQLLNGTISRWRVQASRLEFTANGWRADRMGFSNDPFTPSQTRIDAEDVVAQEQENGDLLISARRNRLIVEESMPIPVTRRQLIEKEEEVDNRWVFGVDNKDRDGLFVGRTMRPLSLGAQTELSLEPQLMVQRAIDGGRDNAGDLFGLEAKLGGRYGRYKLDLKADIGSFDPDRFSDNSRFWGTFGRDIDLGALGRFRGNLFGAYRYRTWNGSLGESNIESAYGAYAEQRGDWKQGDASHRYLVRGAVGNYRADHYRKDRLEETGRATLFASLTSRFPLITGETAELTPTAAYRYSPEPIVPGLTLNTNLNSSLASYGTGAHQKTLSFSGGPTLTLGTFSRSFLDFTQLSIIGGGTLRGGSSPFEFDRAVDLGTLGFGLTQQIVGPVVLSTGVNLNIDPGSNQYGEIINSNIELRWQRRSYDLGVYFNPYEGIGGVRFRLNDFDFTGRGVPFVPYEPLNWQTREDPVLR